MKTLGNRGMSLVEVMVAVGALAVVSLGVMKMTKQQTIVQKRAEAAFEISTASNLITQTLLNHEACVFTLGTGALIADGGTVTAIKNRNNGVIFNTVDKYGNNTVKINTMTITGVSLTGGPGLNQFGELNLEIEFEKISQIITGAKKILKSFPLRVEVTPAGNLVKCYSAIENAVEEAKLEACAGIGGLYDPVTSKCNLSSYNSATTPANDVAVSTRHLTDFYTFELSNTLDPRFVNISGDTMTGKLQVNAEIESSTRVCVAGRCRDFTAAPCPVGEIVRSINTDGSVVCIPDKNTNVFGKKCPAGEFVEGFTSTGALECNVLVATIDYGQCHDIGWGLPGLTSCKNDYVIVGAYSRNSDSGEWNAFRCCKLKN